MVSSAPPPSPLGLDAGGTAAGAEAAAAGALLWNPRDFISGFFGEVGAACCLVPAACSSARQGGDAKDIMKIAGTTMKAMALSTLDLPR